MFSIMQARRRIASYGFSSLVVLFYFIMGIGLVSVALVIVIIIIWLWRRAMEPESKTPPGPVVIPILGSLPHIIWKLKRNPFRLSSFQLLSELRSHFWSGVLGITLGSHKFVILDELPLIKKVLISEDWVNRIKDVAIFKERTFGMDYGLLTSNGDSWKEMRRFVAKTLVKFGFGRGTALQLRHEEEIFEFFQHFEEKYPDVGNSNVGAVVKMQGLFNISSLNILWTMVTSSRFSYDSMQVAKLTALLERMTRDIHPKEMGFFIFPWLRFIPRATAYARFMQDGKELQQYFKNVIEERRGLNLYKSEQTNFVDSFLAEIDHNEGMRSHYTDEQLISVLVDLFATGFLPIASCLEYLIMFMILHPQVQTRCREEIDTVLGGSKQPPSINHTECMPYISATIAETLRVVTFIPLTSRAAVKDTWVNNYFVEKDTVALINLHNVHHDPKIWNEPETFQPERFLDKEGKLINQDITLPFGTGKRVCPAEVFGRLTIFAFFVSLLQRYEFSLDHGNSSPDATPNAAMGNYPKPFTAIVRKLN